jgi:hypothetical protein
MQVGRREILQEAPASGIRKAAHLSFEPSEGRDYFKQGFSLDIAASAPAFEAAYSA